jgi:hypothetical protein
MSYQAISSARLALAVGLVTIFFGAGSVQAQSDIGLLMSPRRGASTGFVRYSGSYTFKGGVEKQGVDLETSRHGLDLALPLAYDLKNELTLVLRMAHREINTQARLPDDGRAIPRGLWDAGVGLNYRRFLSSGWVVGGQVKVGSRSDRLFESGHESWVRLIGVVQTPVKRSRSWFFFLYYSNVSSTLPEIPIPGLAWSYTPSPRLQLLLGLPMSMVRWRPDGRWSLAVSYIVPRTVRFRAGFRILRQVELFLKGSWAGEAYALADRPDKDHRLYYYRKQVVLGIGLNPTKNIKIELTAGYSFDRFIFEGDGYDDRDRNRLDLENAPVIGLNVTIRW